jgi:hypothetical protein
MNKTVNVTGMKVHTVVSSNLLISETNASDASYGNSLSQARECLLEPSSTINGINYYWTATDNVDAQGNAIDDTYTAYSESTTLTAAHTSAGKTAVDTAFNSNYGKTVTAATVGDYDNIAYGYVDYTFYLKAVNSEASGTLPLKLTKLDLESENGTRLEKAWRAAMFVQDATANTPLATAIASTDAKSIFKIADATNFDGANKAIGVNSTTSVVEPVTLAYGTGGAVATYNPANGAVVAEVANGATEYYKITIRLWLEGEDNTCNNTTFAKLTEDYHLELQFDLDNTTTAVSALSLTEHTVTP